MEIIGHRGWPTPAHPENTLAAVRAALDAGASGVEVDLRLTADDEPVCVHDADLLRVAGRRERIRGTLSDELVQIELPGGHTVPRLSDLAAAVAGKGLLVLDIKPDERADLVAHCIVGALPAGFPPADVIVSSVQRSILRAVRRQAPWLRQALISVPGSPVARLLARALEDGIDDIHLDMAAFLRDPYVVAEAHRRQMAVRCWTVNREADAVLASIAAVDGLITDHPDHMGRVIRPGARAGGP